MELTDLPLPPEIWAVTPCAGQALLVALQERIRDLEVRLSQTVADSFRPFSAALPARRAVGLSSGAHRRSILSLARTASAGHPRGRTGGRPSGQPVAVAAPGGTGELNAYLRRCE